MGKDDIQTTRNRRQLERSDEVGIDVRADEVRRFNALKSFHNLVVVLLMFVEPISNILASFIDQGRHLVDSFVYWVQTYLESFGQYGREAHICKRRVRSRDLKSLQFLGQGFSGFIYETTWSTWYGKRKLGRFARKDFPGVESEVFEHEVARLMNLHHPNVVKAFCWTVDRLSCSLVLEFVSNDLQSVVEKEARRKVKALRHGSQDLAFDSITPFKIIEAIYIMLHIARAMEYLHSKGVAHGDLRPNNVLVDLKAYPRIVKVVDFGLIESKKSTTLVSRHARFLQTLEWKAPESLKDFPASLSDSSNEYLCEEIDSDKGEGRLTDANKLADVYSFGIMCTYILGATVSYPKMDYSLTELQHNISSGTLRPIIPATCPMHLRELIQSSWDSNPARRPGFSELLENLQIHYTALVEGTFSGIVQDMQKIRGPDHDHARIVEAIPIGAVVSLLQQLIPAALTKLKTMFQQVKATKGEFRELEGFLCFVEDCSTVYQNIYGGVVNATTTTTMSSFAKTLDDVQKTLDRWSSQNSGFFSRSSGDRVRELQALRCKVESAINLENFSMLASVSVLGDGHAKIRHPPTALSSLQSMSLEIGVKTEKAVSNGTMEEAQRIIQNVSSLAENVCVNKNQCKRVAERFDEMGKALDSAMASLEESAMAQILLVLKKGETLVSDYKEPANALRNVLNRALNYAAFKEIHEQIDDLGTYLYLPAQPENHLDGAAATDRQLMQKNLDDVLKLDDLKLDDLKLDGAAQVNVCNLEKVVYDKCSEVRSASVPFVAMSTSAIRSAEQGLYKDLKYRLAAPQEHQLQCLDVFFRVPERLTEKLMAKIRGNMRPLMRLGSLLDVRLMGESAQWRSVDDSLRSKQEGLADLRNFMIKRPSQEHFQKTAMPRYNFSCAASKGVVIWLSGVTGIDLGHEGSLSCCMDGLVAASVDSVTISQWIHSGEWCPNIPLLQKISSDWSQDHRSKVRKLWIVTEVLYATKFTLTGKSRLTDRVMADPLSGAKVDFRIRLVNENTLELKANRNKHFIVGYRTMRVEYNLDGTPVLFRKPEDKGLRGDDDDPQQPNLVAMEEDMFEDDQDEFIPLLTPAEQELVELFSSVADSSVAERGSSSVY